ncbi:MAG: EamA family transporter [Rhodoferax ferrireducens]|uniref:EamA family transporter n=2 Tax=Pseudomonadota TaxID=1224 RepID=A0A1Y1R045_9GAMM|nr:MAG: EamA family transporter [Rhodoferax ferrireducens]OQX17502.1 MAG: EamA family transporter [Thiothrix lacustris]
MTTRQALDARASSLMLLLCLLWGLQQVVLKATAHDIAPIMQIGLRSGAAAVLLGLWMLWRKERMSLTDGTLRAGLMVGALFALEFLLVGEGLRHTSASHAVVFLYTAPIFVALGLHIKLPAERLSWVQWAGIGLAFTGIVLTFFGRSQAASSTLGPAMMMLWGDALALLAGMAWAATTVVVRCSALASAPASQTLMYQLVGAFVLLMLAATVLGQAHIHFTPMVWGSLVFQSVIVSFASFLAWFWLLRHYLASRLGVFSFLTPLFGMGFGVWLLGEPLEPRFVLGAVLVLAGVLLVSSQGWLVAAKTRRARA